MVNVWFRPLRAILRRPRTERHSVHRASVHRAMVGQFSDGEPVLVRAGGNPRTTAHTLRLNERFIRGNDQMQELNRGHRQSILPLRNERLFNCALFNCAQSFMRRTNEVAGQETHGRHVVFTAVSALVICPGRLAVPGDWEGITLLAVGAFGMASAHSHAAPPKSINTPVDNEKLLAVTRMADRRMVWKLSREALDRDSYGAQRFPQRRQLASARGVMAWHAGHIVCDL